MKESTLKIWVEAARPKTLAAAFVPVLVGAGMAWEKGEFSTLSSLIALICALLIQIGTNFANDYYDFVKGSDKEDRIGFRRATATGLISPDSMFRATIFTMGLAFLLGLYLVWVGGWIVLVIGILSLIFGIMYTGGPFPLGYNGLGDLFVFVFFGIVAVMTTYYVNALEWSEATLWPSVAIGALSVNILVINNLRDVEQDRKSGKKTLGVLLGESALKVEYSLMILIAYIMPCILYLFYAYNLFIFLPFITLPLALNLIHPVWNEEDKRKLNQVLEQTARFMFIFGVTFTLGILLNS